MNASQFYALAQQLQDAYACIMRPLCEKNGLAQHRDGYPAVPV